MYYDTFPTYSFVFETDISHHGINGQKWGIMNGPPYPLGYESHSSKEKATNSKATIDSYSKTNPKPNSVSENKSYSVKTKNNLIDNAKLKVKKSNGQIKKTARKTVDNVEDTATQIKEKGLTEEQRELIKRAAMVAGLVAVGALTATAAYYTVKKLNTDPDSVIKAGTKISRITGNVAEGFNDRFYATVNNFDKEKYGALYIKSLYNRRDDAGNLIFSQVFRKNMNLKKDIKVAGRINAAKVYKELLKDSEEFRKVYGGKDYNFFNYHGLMFYANSNHLKYIPKGVTLEQAAAANKIYFDKLTSMGYGALVDINDADHWYQSIKPVIFFNTTSDALEIGNIEYISKSQMYKNVAKNMPIQSVQEVLKKSESIPIITGFASSSAALYGSLKVDEILKESGHFKVEDER